MPAGGPIAPCEYEIVPDGPVPDTRTFEIAAAGDATIPATRTSLSNSIIGLEGFDEFAYFTRPTGPSGSVKSE